MSKLHHRSRTLLRAAIGAAVLAVPSTALADCAKVVDRAAFKGSVVEYYPQACYSAGLKQLGPDVNTYSPNVARNLKSAMRRDRTRKLKFTIVWMKKNRVLVTSNFKVKSGLQVRKGRKVLAKGSISGKGATLKLKKTNGKLTVALTWALGKRTITVARTVPPGAVVKKLKLTIQRLAAQKVRIRSNFALASAIQVRQGKKILSRGLISSKTTTLKLKKTSGDLTVALVWPVGEGRVTVTKLVRAA
jgi:hypothetical protein